MWNGKNKAFTISLDDGVVHDKRAIEIFNRYNLKATFNLNSGFLGNVEKRQNYGKIVSYDKILPDKIKEIYSGHEIACHTVSHPRLTTLEDSAVLYQVETDRKILSELSDQEVVGLAYPCGVPNNDDRVAELIRSNTPIKYARTNDNTYSFDLQENLLRFNPTMPFEYEVNVMKMAREFVEMKTDTPKLFYIWGHSYEFECEDVFYWTALERFCEFISNRDDIFYGTNRQVLLDK